MSRAIGLAFAFAAGLVAVPALAADTAHAVLKGPNGEEMGTVTLSQERDAGVVVHLEATGLAAGGHGFHIHQTGKCEPDFKAAGDHFEPESHTHGFLAKDGSHAGDLPNIFADSSGKATADAFTDRISLRDGADSLFDEDGSAFIIHEKPDTYAEDPGAGGRVACGVIEKGNP